MPVIYKVPPIVLPLKAPEVGEQGYQGFHPRSEVLAKGWTSPDSQRPLPCPILVEHDVAIPTRDGTKLYCDVYRPPDSADGTKVPALLNWSPFGKKFNGIRSLELMTPWNLGIPPDRLSGLEKFEGVDPADWVPRGYAVLHVDTRGAFDSQGVMCILGTQEAEDGYDAIEWVARQPWCSGSVGLAGNSHLAIAQWFIAAQQPPSLKAIAPWEGCGDLYREQFARGGIYGGGLFDKLIIPYMLRGRRGIESFRAMFDNHPFANEWWNDKRPDLKRIRIPTYITGTWTNTMHGMGAIRGWLEIDTPHKWLRWHGTQEWYDLWGNPNSQTELELFFDRYLKDEDNGWEATPRVRMAALRFGLQDPIENIVVQDFPIPNTDYRSLYLTSDGRLSSEAPSESSVLRYNSETKDTVSFTLRFAKETRLIGMAKAVLYMACPDADDWDVFVFVEKLDAQGQPMINLNLPWAAVPIRSFAEIKAEEKSEVVLYQGPTGMLRASLREIDTDKSIHPNWPFYPQSRSQKIPLGTVVRLEIGIWAFGVQYDAGESLRVHVGGQQLSVTNFGVQEHVQNRGTHEVYVGGKTASFVSLPFV
ncbi:hypothetical protein SEUCBS140593_003017 [Sporothrix eucalyptigena]|uniref:Xaa-Pro dipeptidyl-peptidase C-terminal domain-containing protein n=1 Tax=Sporothrix eucalyptigena TaxID=1812306 RepID=A0ABP0BCI6_9PEZI